MAEPVTEDPNKPRRAMAALAGEIRELREANRSIEQTITALRAERERQTTEYEKNREASNAAWLKKLHDIEHWDKHLLIVELDATKSAWENCKRHLTELDTELNEAESQIRDLERALAEAQKREEALVRRLDEVANEREAVVTERDTALAEMREALEQVESRVRNSEFPDIMPFTYAEISDIIRAILAKYPAAL